MFFNASASCSQLLARDDELIVISHSANSMIKGATNMSESTIKNWPKELPHKLLYIFCNNPAKSIK